MPAVYWLTVVIVSIVGTLITDLLTDKLQVPLKATSTVFAVALADVFLLWRKQEGTLSIHSVTTRSREAFYWSAILLTFALGTASGDLVAEAAGVGYLPSAIAFAAIIDLITAAYYVVNLNAVFAFWAAYTLTRPLGASVGDYLTQVPSDGGLGLGTVPVSVAFLIIVFGLVGYLTLTKKDQRQPIDGVQVSV